MTKFEMLCTILPFILGQCSFDKYLDKILKVHKNVYHILVSRQGRFLFFAIYIFMPLTFTEAYIYYLCTSNTYNVGGILGNSVCIWKEIRLAKSFWANIQQNRKKRWRIWERERERERDLIYHPIICLPGA